jgi:hypothetical protein
LTGQTSKDDDVAKQKADYLEILDTYKKLNYKCGNCSRSVGDAFIHKISTMVSF